MSTSASNSASAAEPIPACPPPWPGMKTDIYLFGFLGSARTGLPPHAYHPLEGSSFYADAASGKYVGGLGMVQVIRYHDTPVGPYDELIVVPGSFEYTRDDAEGRRVKRKNVKISRIYVSQKHTCYNGRINWNVPKHLAKFTWTTNPDGSQTVQVFPHDTDPVNDPHETTPSALPFFQATLKPVRFAPAFPFKTDWIKSLGFDTTLVHPPLPTGKGSQGELPGTDKWCAVVPHQSSSRTMLCWFDMAQHRDAEGALTAQCDNFWPGLGRWQVGLKMENATIEFGHAEDQWESPRSNL